MDVHRELDVGGPFFGGFAGLAQYLFCKVMDQTGFVGDFSWVKLPGVLDAAGQPRHEDGIATVPGLYFAGLEFGVTRKSGTIPAVAEEAGHMVDHIVKRQPASRPSVR